MILYVPQTHRLQVQTYSPFAPFVSQIVNITYYSCYSYNSSTFWSPTLYTIATLRFATALHSYGGRNQKSLPVTSPAWFSVRILPQDFFYGFLLRIFVTAYSSCLLRQKCCAAVVWTTSRFRGLFRCFSFKFSCLWLQSVYCFTSIVTWYYYTSRTKDFMQ